MQIIEASLDDLLHRTYEYILANGENVEPRKGSNKEVRNCVLTLKNPRSRISLSEVRSPVISCVGEFLWYLSSSDSIEFIEYYIPNYRKNIKFDDSTEDPVPGAYGPRIFGADSQFEKIIKLLSNPESKESRRAVISIYAKTDLIGSDSRDIPCTCVLQFFIRENKLHLTTYMRSNDAAMGLVHDIFSFTLLQELMLCKLISFYPNLQLGEYTHIVGSLHIYNKDICKIEHYLHAEGWHHPVSMPPLNPQFIKTSIDKLLVIEKALRLEKVSTLDKLDKIEDIVCQEMAVILFAHFYLNSSPPNIEGLKGLKSKNLSQPITAFLNKRIQTIQINEKVP